jgi:peptidoglycan/xylan/chitin deacetylase (PgdA/CDA1 family)
MATSIPVLLYHRVNDLNQTSFDIPLDLFQEHLEYLAEEGFGALTANELVRCLKGELPLPPKPVMITFDDGYLDNWVYAYPLLQRYGLRATLFVITGRIKEKTASYRPHWQDVASGEYSLEDLPRINKYEAVNRWCAQYPGQGSEDFVTWEEMKKMQDDGVMEVLAHTHLHGFNFVSEKVIDFYHPGAKWIHVDALNSDLRYGVPVYDLKSALAARKYINDSGLRDRLADYVKQHGAVKFFDGRDWKDYFQELSGVMKDYQEKFPSPGSWESEEDYKKRVLSELSLSKKMIEEHLGRACSFLAWPMGHFNQELITWAREVGYQGAFTTLRGPNARGTDPFRITRFKVKNEGLGWFMRRLKIYSNKPLAKVYSFFYKK